MNKIPQDAKGTLYVVSTSHMDWDWNCTFEQYYGTTRCIVDSVKEILEQAISLIESNDGYQYNLAEMAWLQRYLRDKPGVLPQLKTFKDQLFFLGGGITSPDNLVCNGEAFIRNYLVGRTFIKEAGLDELLTNVCWIPDDFGHDPQLPVVLNAMGMTGVSFWRVPGNEPVVCSGTPPQPGYLPSDGSDALSYLLEQQGVTFRWRAADGSTILTQQMSDGYGVIWNQADTSDNNPATLNSFVTAKLTIPTRNPCTNPTTGNNLVNQPGNLFMAPCGGDFSFPSGSLVDTVNSYNNDYYEPGGAHYNATGVYAVLATFQEYIDAMNQYDTSNPGTLLTHGMDASNFWTGYFASRPQLKINQLKAVNELMTAETLSTLLRVNGSTDGNNLQLIAKYIAASWEALVPSTHHDYVTGTSPDTVYEGEQLSYGETALKLSSNALTSALTQLGASVQTFAASSSEIPYIIFNPVGFNRTSSMLIEIDATPALAGIQSVRLPEGQGNIPIQRTQSGKILFQYAYMDSMSYITVYLSTSPYNNTQPPGQSGQDNYTFTNNIVSVTVTEDSGWAISSLVDIGGGNQELIQANGYGNRLNLYYETPTNSKSTAYGNLYQMGNEMAPTATDGSGFFADEDSVYTADPTAPGTIIEKGPLLWHFSGGVINNRYNTKATIDYFLYANDPTVYMKITGNAASSVAGSVVTVWDLRDGVNQPSGINYGTPNHWLSNEKASYYDGYEYKPYWNGPCFRPVHDYLTLLPANDPGGAPVAAVYTGAMHAWAYYNKNQFNGQPSQEQLLGILFRNAFGTQRGAHGTDTGTHTQYFAFRVPGSDGIGRPETCQPLQQSVAFQMPLLAVPAITVEGVDPIMPETGQLASMEQQNAIIRVARPQTNEAGDPFSFVFRMYQPTNDTSQSWSMRFLPPSGDIPSVSFVTALEEPLDIPAFSQPAYNNGTIMIPAMPTLTTIRVQL
jgi:alpha-mannosidase